MPTYTIYASQHAIHLAIQIESRIKTKIKRNLDNILKIIDEVNQAMY